MSVLGSPAYTRGMQIVNNYARNESMSSAGGIIIPANTYVQQIIVHNKTANAVLGGVKIGTTDGGVDVLAALAVGANANNVLTANFGDSAWVHTPPSGFVGWDAP